jgi:hypothetical protein
VQAVPQRTFHLRFLTGRPAVAAALVVGIAGDYLLRGGPWGVAFAVWIGLAILSAVSAAPTAAARRTHAAELAPAFVFALGLAMRDSPVLRAWNVFGTVLWLAVPVVRRSGVRLSTARIGDFVAGAARAAVGALLGPIAGRAASGPPPAPRAGPERLRPLAIGAALALPVLVVFGSLLRSADPAFDRVLGVLWRWDLDVALSHLALVVALAWVAVGYLSTLRTPTTPYELAPPFVLGPLEVAIPLGALAILFFAFDAVQVQYLAGGAAFVRDTLGLTFAEHARRGFFQLVATTGLVLVVLLGAGWTLRSDDVRVTRIFRRLAAVVLAAALPIPVAAFWRLGLYVDAYGLSEDRLYASAVMLWIVWCLVWLATTTLRLDSRRFAYGAWVAGFVTLLLVNAVNPDALIARVNLDRAGRGVALDTKYLMRLSADAAPTILSNANGVDTATRCALVVRWGPAGVDWRTWNVGRWRARKAARASVGCG